MLLQYTEGSSNLGLVAVWAFLYEVSTSHRIQGFSRGIPEESMGWAGSVPQSDEQYAHVGILSML